ncbi:MAG: bifunctional UDP-N-acetylglucosamine diphosphorylase/glucosamine-1-phosphate N-acetyltransferase GlmU [Myxococcota bacterium]
MDVAAIILAAGKGTRMNSGVPKALHPLSGRPLVTFAMQAALDAGARQVVVVVGHAKDKVEAVVHRHCPEARIAVQAEQKGTGHAAQCGAAEVDLDIDRVWVMNGDVPLLRPQTLMGLRAHTGTRAVGLVSVHLDDPTGYGRVLRDLDGAPDRIVEHRDADEEIRRIREVNAGIYDVDRGFLVDATARLRPENDQAELYLTDIVAAARSAGGTAGFHLDDAEEAVGINTRTELAGVQSLLWRRAGSRLLETGVTVVDPMTAYIDPWVEVGMDTVIHPQVHLRGSCRVGRNCIIDVGAILEDAVLEDNVHVHAYSIVQSAVVRDGASVGPFARLRPGTELGPDAKVGNFVETKNTRFGRGAKANHLSYLGDAWVGDATNVGAGTITCNYDGYGKHPTVIGPGTFVGSNATLVAPVTLGARAYVAAGSTVTADAPDDSLVFGRARQVNKEGRAQDVRQRAEAASKTRGS